MSARPAGYWVWSNGLTDRVQMERELRAFKAVGLSGVYIFDVGARSRDVKVPSGPAFMGSESLDAIEYTVREAARLGLEVGLITSSSWNCGGPWVPPRFACMGLYMSHQDVQGSGRWEGVLPLPELPAQAPRNASGKPRFLKNVAVLAVPAGQRLGGHEFLFELAPPHHHTIDRVVLYNTLSGSSKRYGPHHLFAKDFEVLVSNTTPDADSFHKLLHGTLEPTTDTQTFRFPAAEARYLKLRILSGHNPKFDRVQLGEFEAYTPDGRNVVALYHEDHSRTGATLLHCTSALGSDGNWSASNIHDGKLTDPDGSWSSAGPPPVVIRDSSQIVDLTDRLGPDGHLTWDVPKGQWSLMRFVCANTGQQLAVPSPKSDGLAIDHFNPDATRFHFRYLTDRLHQRLGPDFTSTALKYLYACSYELRGSTWTPNFLAEFQTRRGYDMVRYLPTLFGAVVESPEVTERFRYDFRKTLGDLLVDAFYRTATEEAHGHGLKLVAEAGGPGLPLHQVPVDALKAQGAIDIPRGEFWQAHNVWVVKETACAAHIYGKPAVQMEAFTTFRHWQDGPFALKQIADRAFCGGANHFVWHTMPHVPRDAGLPGWVYGAGTHFGPSLVWWPMAKPFIDYLSRCSYLLQQGLFVADVCYYYGDQGFNFVPPKHVDPSLGPGYDYDVANAEAILNRMSVREGRLVLPDGMNYELLVLPDRQDIDLDVLRKLNQLVRAGATVVGPKPTRSNGLTDYPHRDRQVRELADRLWGPCDGQKVQEHSVGKGHIIWGRPLRTILADRRIGPDVVFSDTPSDARLDFIHRRTRDADIYFIANQLEREEQADVTFRVAGKQPELWDPASGTIQPAVVYDTSERTVTVPVRLPPLGSGFVVFRHRSPEEHLVAIGRRGSSERIANQIGVAAQTVLRMPGNGQYELMTAQSGSYGVTTGRGETFSASVEPLPAARNVTGPWTVRFTEGWGAPTSVVFPELQSWTDHADDGIQHYSGIACYERTFDMPADWLRPGRRVDLDLGRLWAIAEVTCNDQRLGVVWKPPYRIDITSAAQTGPNRLLIKVANTWSNRLVGDTSLPTEQRFCHTNVWHSNWQSWKSIPLHASGLLGPVRLIPLRQITLSVQLSPSGSLPTSP